MRRNTERTQAKNISKDVKTFVKDGASLILFVPISFVGLTAFEALRQRETGEDNVAYVYV